MEIIWKTVLVLPSFPAARVMPRVAATIRSMVIRNSREMTMRTRKRHQAGSNPNVRSPQKSPMMKILSATASRSLPRSEIALSLRARKPSIQSVIAAKIKRISEQIRAVLLSR